MYSTVGNTATAGAVSGEREKFPLLMIIKHPPINIYDTVFFFYINYVTIPVLEYSQRVSIYYILISYTIFRVFYLIFQFNEERKKQVIQHVIRFQMK
jgi:hypothetical protein